MRTHTSNFKEKIKELGREIDSKITYGNNIIASENLYSISPILNGELLKSVMKELDFESSTQIPQYTVIKYEFGLKVDGEYEYLNYGNYIVYSSEYNEDTRTYEHICYDSMLFTMKEYTTLQNGTFPMTVREYLTNLCLDCNLVFKNANDTFANHDKTIESDLYANLGYTYRDIFDELSQVTASSICTDSNNMVEVRYIKETNDTIDEEYLKDINVKFGEKYGPINSIVFSRSGESDNVFLRDEDSVSSNGICELKIIDNQIMNFNDRSDYLPDILARLNGLEYFLNDYSSTGILYYEMLDKYNVKIGDNTYPCILFNDEPKITQGLVEDIYTELPEESVTDYTKADKTDRRINQAYILVDKQNQRIDAVVSDVNTNKEKVASLEITTGNISTKVTSVETDLNTTKNSLSNLSNTVDTLSDEIDGVSADFEDFKDNEYIQSIDNLQKQIDGAIQFWNGEEIPTINNYPANLWITENDKINHQADIYTVIQDIEGEMKQGKSYRFDKVGGVWQWIELTDNELSAVQAIAQEALNKANANIIEIGTIKTNVSELQQTDEQIKASVESIDKQIIPTATATGTNIYIEEASDDPLIQLEIEGRTVQETRSGKNLVNCNRTTSTTGGVTVTRNEDGTFTLNGTSSNAHEIALFTNDSFSVKAGKYYKNSVQTISGTVTGTKNGTCQLKTDNGVTWAWLTSVGVAKTPDIDGVINYAGIYAAAGTVFDNWKIGFQIEEVASANASATEWEAYGVKPSPDYPSEIESVGYENLFDVSKITEKTALMSADGSTSTSSVSNLSDYIEVKANKLYTLSFEYDTLLNSAERGFCYYDKDKKFLRGKTYSQTGKKEGIAPTEDGYVRFSYDMNCYNIQVAEGEHSYIPYGKYGIEVKTVGKNLFDGNYVNGGIGGDGVWNFNNTTRSAIVEVKPNTQYVVAKFDNNGLGTRFIIGESPTYLSSGESGIVLYNKSSATTTTITTSSTTKYLYVYVTNDINSIPNLMVSETGGEYEPYQKNTSVITLNAPLRSLPNGVKDIAYIKNNKLYVDRYVGSVVLDGSETWYKMLLTGNKYYFQYVPSINQQTINGKNFICSHFKAKNRWSEEIVGMWFDKNMIITTDGSLNGTETVEDFKTWLSTHNTQVDYEFGTPVTEEISEIEMLSIFKGVNRILSTDNLEPTLNIEYVRDTTLSNYVEGQINKVMTIEERHYSELVIEDDNIKASVTEVSSNLDSTNSTLNSVESKITSQEATINVISKNIDTTTGEIREVTTTNGFTFNSKGLNIYTDENSYNTQINNVGTYYRDGNEVVSKTDKDGFLAKDVKEQGQHSYSYDDTNKIYDFIDEKIEVDGEYCYATFYNGEE